MLRLTYLDELNAETVDRLLSETPEEGRHIEYKLELPGNSREDKKEFLADVTSFANTGGGYLLFGVKEISGVPSSAQGVEVGDRDKEKQRLENLMRTCIDPRIADVRIDFIAVDADRDIVVLRVPRSWALPHMVRTSSRFYCRNSVGKYPLEVSELRRLFNETATITQQARNFRLDRLSHIVAGESALGDIDRPIIALHVVPLNAFYIGSTIETDLLVGEYELALPMRSSSRDHRHNFDGVLFRYPSPEDGPANTYLQIFRNGCVEAVNVSICKGRASKRLIPSTLLEKCLIDSTERYFALLNKADVAAPVLLMVSILGVKGYSMAVDPRRFDLDPWDVNSIDRDELIVEPQIVESLDVEAAKVLKPILDSVWNASGWKKSPYYDDDGTWTG